MLVGLFCHSDMPKKWSCHCGGSISWLNGRENRFAATNHAFGRKFSSFEALCASG